MQLRRHTNTTTRTSPHNDHDRGEMKMATRTLWKQASLTLCTILTGVLSSLVSSSPPSQSEEQGNAPSSQRLADIAVMQNLTHQPKDQVEEAMSLPITLGQDFLNLAMLILSEVVSMTLHGEVSRRIRGRNDQGRVQLPARCNTRSCMRLRRLPLCQLQRQQPVFGTATATPADSPHEEGEPPITTEGSPLKCFART